MILLSCQLSLLALVRVLCREKVQCHFWVWYWQDEPSRWFFKEGFPQPPTPRFWRTVSWQPPAFSCFRICLSCRENYFKQGHALPKAAYIQWLIVVRIGGSRQFCPIAEQLWWAFARSSPGCCLRLCQACITFHFSLCLILFAPPTFRSVIPWWMKCGYTLYPHFVCLSVCFHRTQPMTLV